MFEQFEQREKKYKHSIKYIGSAKKNTMCVTKIKNESKFHIIKKKGKKTVR